MQNSQTNFMQFILSSAEKNLEDFSMKIINTMEYYM